MSKKPLDNQDLPMGELKDSSTASTIIAESVPTNESQISESSVLTPSLNRFSFLNDKRKSLSDLFAENEEKKNCCLIL